LTHGEACRDKDEGRGPRMKKGRAEGVFIIIGLGTGNLDSGSRMNARIGWKKQHQTPQPRGGGGISGDF